MLHKNAFSDSANTPKNYVFIVCSIYAAYMLHKEFVRIVKKAYYHLFLRLFHLRNS